MFGLGHSHFTYHKRPASPCLSTSTQEMTGWHHVKVAHDQLRSHEQDESKGALQERKKESTHAGDPDDARGLDVQCNPGRYTGTLSCVAATAWASGNASSDECLTYLSLSPNL